MVGAVPLLVVVAQYLVGEVVHYLHGADGQTVSVAAVGVDDGEHLFVDAHGGFHAGAPLFVDDAALLVNFCFAQSKAVAPVAENPEA